MKTKSLYLIIFLATMGGFVSFVDYHQGHSLSRAQAEITTHARIISRSLWNLEPSDPTGYLSLAASANHYETVVVRDETGAVFLELTRDPATALDRFFISLGLMHRRQLEAPIGFEGVPIGRIEATWLQKTTYIYIYIFIFLLLLLAVAWLFLKLIEANRTLEDKVRLRTHELEQDITARRRTEREVRRLRNYLSNIIDAMPSILVGVDNDCRVTLWNHSAETATGVAVGSALGKPLIELLPHLGAERERIRTAMVEKRIRRDAKIPRRKGRDLRYEDVTIFPLDAEGEKGAVIRIDDVTERARMEDTLVQSEKMLSVGGLAAGMAHEINNPLAGMMQSLSVVQQRLSAELPVNVRAAAASGTRLEAVRAYMRARGIPEMLTTIQTEGRRAAAIVQNMLSFARKRDQQWSTQHIGEILDAAVELASTDYDLKKKYDFRLIEIVKEYEVDLPPIPCEKQMIQQVFLNILRNGAEAMQNSPMTRKPRFTLRVRAAQRGVERVAQRGVERAAQRNTGMGAEAMVCVEIEDNGPGIDEATRRRIFEPFFTTKPVGVGTGLGLSVSYFIITENHKGRLRVEAPPEGGTRFVVCLPAVRKAQYGHAERPDAGEAVPGSGD